MTAPFDHDGSLASSVASEYRLSRLAAAILWLFIGYIAVSTISLFLPAFLSIPFGYELNYNEGWNIYNTARLINHEIIYDNNFWRVNNYPIGSFLIIAGVNYLFHDLLLSGRLVAAISFLAIGVLTGAATRRFGGDWADTVFGGVCALGFCYLMAPGWVAVDDPQSLAEAIMLSGFVSYISRPADHLGLLRTALLVVSAGFVKHNLLAIPLAITFDLALRSPRDLRFWLWSCAGATTALLALTYIIAGGAFIAHLLSPRIFSWERVRHNFMKYLRLFKFPLLAMIPFLPTIFPRDRRVLAAYGLLSVVIAAIFSGFEGTSYNMFQDAAAFLGIAAGVLLHETRKRIASASGGSLTKVIALAAVPVMLAQPIWAKSLAAFDRLYNIRDFLAAGHRDENAFSAEITFIAARPGPAICESLLMCYRAGKPFILDPFNSRQYLLAGKLDENELVRRVASHEFAVVQIRGDICDDPATGYCHILHYEQKVARFTDQFLYAVNRYYKIGWRSEKGILYVPK